MAAKNPKRVAAGKKAWRNRGKGKARRRGGARSGRRSGRKPIQRGITGKVGAFILGVAPVVLATTDAIQRATAVKKSRKLSMLGTVHYGFMRWISDLSNGFIGVEPFTEPMQFGQEDGGTTSFAVTSGLPKGSLLYTAATGLTLMVFDWGASKLAGGRPVKIMGTNYNATGGS